jgi:hypothetical protein
VRSPLCGGAQDLTNRNTQLEAGSQALRLSLASAENRLALLPYLDYYRPRSEGEEPGPSDRPRQPLLPRATNAEMAGIQEKLLEKNRWVVYAYTGLTMKMMPSALCFV